MQALTHARPSTDLKPQHSPLILPMAVIAMLAALLGGFLVMHASRLSGATEATDQIAIFYGP